MKFYECEKILQFRLDAMPAQFTELHLAAAKRRMDMQQHIPSQASFLRNMSLHIHMAE